MALQDLYDQFLRLARLNPRVVMGGAEVADPCHVQTRGSTPVCLSPEDLADPQAQSIVYNGKRLGPLEILETFRQLVRLDDADGLLDGKLPSDALPLWLTSNPISAIRYFGPHWTPDRRLQTFLRWYRWEEKEGGGTAVLKDKEGKMIVRETEGKAILKKLAQMLPAPDASFKLARSFVEGRKRAFLDEAHPLMKQEVAFITDTAKRLRDAGHAHAADAVMDIMDKTRIVPFHTGMTDELGRTMLFPQFGPDGPISVFFSTTMTANGRRFFYLYDVARPPYRTFRGWNTREFSLKHLMLYLRGAPLPKPLHPRIPNFLRDIYIYRYLRYRVGPTDRLRDRAYMWVVVLHEALHAAALAKAPVVSNGHGGGSQPTFDWDAYAARLSERLPNPTDTADLVDYLSDLIMFQRAALEVAQELARRIESPGEEISVEDVKRLQLALQLYVLADEANEYLVDEAAWRLTFKPGQLSEQPLPPIGTRLFNPNEETVLTRQLR